MKSIVAVQTRNKITIISLNRPEKRNALNPEMIRELTSLFQSINSGVILLRGEGKAFCAGADLAYMKNMKNFSYEENVQDSLELAKLFRSMVECSVPILCTAHGAVYGGGIGLVAASDIAIVTEDTQFCFSEVRLGLAPAVISPYVISRIGQAKAKKLFLTAEVFSAQEALEFNLADNVSETVEEMEKESIALAELMLKNGQEAMKAVKKMPGLFPVSDEREKELAELIASLRISKEAQLRMSNFLKSAK
ncbi:MAG: hypothetical protein D6767_02290 [Candidatus Hydrogenedentota bacterium]|nr:MAG: hypothetical protein D6767_02290 [Candidatus Hydrogenedentota bacterium]